MSRSGTQAMGWLTGQEWVWSRGAVRRFRGVGRAKLDMLYTYMRDGKEGKRGWWMEVEGVEEGEWGWRGGIRGPWAD